jgi:hypothetical protein
MVLAHLRPIVPVEGLVSTGPFDGPFLDGSQFLEVRHEDVARRPLQVRWLVHVDRLGPGHVLRLFPLASRQPAVVGLEVPIGTKAPDDPA